MSFFLIITCSDWQARRSCVGTSPSGRGMLPSTSWGQSCPALGWEPHGGSPTPRPLVGRSRTALVRKCNAGEKKTRTQRTISILIWYELDKEQLMLMAVCLPSYLFIYSIHTQYIYGRSKTAISKCKHTLNVGYCTNWSIIHIHPVIMCNTVPSPLTIHGSPLHLFITTTFTIWMWTRFLIILCLFVCLYFTFCFSL